MQAAKVIRTCARLHVRTTVAALTYLGNAGVSPARLNEKVAGSVKDQPERSWPRTTFRWPPATLKKASGPEMLTLDAGARNLNRGAERRWAERRLVAGADESGREGSPEVERILTAPELARFKSLPTPHMR